MKMNVSMVLVFVVMVTGFVPLRAEQNDPIQLENDHYQLSFDQSNGSIISIYDKSGKIELIADARLAESFRICLPIPATLTDPGTQANYIIGRQQKLTSAERFSNGVTLAWNGPLRNEQSRPYDISVEMEIKFVGSGIEFKVSVSNRTALKLMEVWYPIIGGIQGLGERKQTLTHIPWNAGDYNSEIFWNTRLSYGLGIGVPEHLLACPGGMPESWMSIYNKNLNRTMYFGLHDNANQQKVLRIEMQPGIGVLRQGDSWPRADEIDKDTPLGMIFCWIYYLPPEKTEAGQKFEGAPIRLQFDSGDWKNSATVYQKWKTSISPNSYGKQGCMRPSFSVRIRASISFDVIGIFEDS